MMDVVRQEVVRAADTVVIKIGSNVLAHPNGGLDTDHLGHLTEQIAEIHESGKRVVLVSSGAIAAGLGRLDRAERPSSLPELQAIAAIGQSDLIQAYDRCLRRHGFHAAQILLTAEDFNDRARYLNARNCIRKLLDLSAVPIINENDTVSVAEIKFGDNDRLAALVTNLLRAPLLVILSVVDGLFDGDWMAQVKPEPIDKVLDLDERILSLAGRTTSSLGTGGMRSKLEAARIATAAGETVWIANGKTPGNLRRIFAGEAVGTLVLPKGEAINSRKRWLGLTARPRGTLVVDLGAEAALKHKGRSLLPVGVVEVRGSFGPGDVVDIASAAGEPFARGLSNYSSEEARQIQGKTSDRIPDIIPHGHYDELVHRDHLVLLS